MALPGYAKSEIEILRDCEKILRSLMMCRTYDGSKCAPNDDDY